MKIRYAVVGAAVLMISASTAVAHDTIQSDIELAVEAAIEKLIPSGTVIAYLGRETSDPAGWEICGLGEGAFPSLEDRILVHASHG